MQNSQDDYLFITDFMNGEKREWRKRELSSAVDPTKTPELRERLERANGRNVQPLTQLMKQARRLDRAIGRRWKL